MKQFYFSRVTGLYQRSFITLRCLQILTVIYITLPLICEIQGNDKQRGLTTLQVQEQQRWRLNWTDQMWSQIAGKLNACYRFGGLPPYNGRNSNTLSEFKVRHRRQSTATVSPPTYVYKETWSEHTTKLNRMTWKPKPDYNPLVFIYFDTQLQTASGKFLDRGAYWSFEFTADVWHYMTKIYGQFGPDPYLYLTVHDMKDSNGVYIGYSVNPQNPNKIHFRNVLDIWYTNRDDWVKIETRQEAKDLIVNNLAYFVEKSYKDHYGSPSFNVWKGDLNGHTAWVDIFTYDVYKSLNWTNEAASYEQKVRNRFEASPKNTTFWFQEWFIPIYNNQTFHSGGNRVLRNYFQLIYDYAPKNTDKVYTYNFTLGEFVHFWSGAANASLKSLAEKVFGWSEDLDREFTMARTTFSEVSKLYAYEAITEQPTSPPTTTTTPIVTTQVHINNIATTISAVTSKNSSDSGSTENETANKNTYSGSHNKQSSKNSPVTLVASVAGSIIFLLIIVLITTYICQKKRIIYLEADIRMLTSDEVDDFFEGNKDTSISTDEAQALIMAMPFITAFEIPKDQMVLDYAKVLGSGQFGSVVQGQIPSSENNEMISVAMKTVKPNVDVDSFKAFLSEVKIMAYLGKHENIVELLGTCTAHIQNREIYIALEFCHLGSLESYLKKNRDKFKSTRTGKRRTIISALRFSASADTNDKNIRASAVPGNKIDSLDLLKWSREVSNAMIYLTEKKVIHGDLAARNVLLTEHRIAKISDFGLSRQFLNYANYMKTSKVPVPWRWLAVESLKDMKFSTASDVWAFGVTLWEIFSLSEIPYGAWTYDLFFADRLIAGDRLGMPKHGNEQIYKLMQNCWKVEPAERPSFQNIYNILNEHISNNLDFVSLNEERGKDSSTIERRKSLTAIAMETVSEAIV